MKKIFSALFVVLFATSMMAQTGLTCEDAIPIDKDYKGRVEGPCELWYTAWSYDLPLHVYFSPDSAGSTTSPEVYVDFTCTPGYYEDPKVDSILTKMSIFGVELPMEFWCDGVFRNGKQEWDLSVSKTYREQLAESGITYNIQAFVRVVFNEAGSISLTPDTTYTSCMDNEYVQLGDTIEILPNDADRVFVMPFTDWQNDSVRFVWEGEQDATVWLAVQYCDFTPDNTSSFVWDTYHLTADQPHKLQQQQIVDIIQQHKEGGIYFGKILSQSAGKLVVEKIPMAPIEGGATLLEYGTSVEVNNADQLFCFPRTWKATDFVSSANSGVTMYMSTTPEFTPATTDANVMAYHTFTSVDGEYHNYISNTEMSGLLSSISGDYIYVRFLCAESTSILPEVWNASSCANKSLMIRPDQTFSVAAKSQSTIYRLLYEDWKNCGILIEWGGNSTLPTYIADTCSFVVSATSPNVLLYSNIKRKGTLELDAETIASWASRIDADGYLYVCFNPTNKGNVTFTCIRPEKPEPVYTTISETLCYGESYEWNGQVYAKSGEYSQTFVAANGADSIVTLNLTILPAVPVTKETATVCHGETYDWQGTTYSESGEYSVTLKNVNGCDSVVTLNLTILPAVAPTSEEVTVAYGETYEWHGVVYAESGSYTITLQDENGCDYRATLHLTVLPNPEKTDLQPTDMMLLALQDAFKVMTMEQGLWSAQDVKLHWDGSSPLHVFVAKQQVYALTPYNRHVLHYEMIPAGADWVLSTDMMAAWESYIVEGVLYVRFLTELPGTLTTTVAE